MTAAVPASRRMLPLLDRALAATACAVVASAPFAAWETGLPGGNFSRNLAYPFVLLFLPLMALRRVAGRPVPWPGAGFSRTAMAATTGYFVFLALVSVGAGLVLDLQGYSAEGQRALIRGVAKAQVPLVILALVWTGFWCHAVLPPAWLRAAVRTAALLPIGYGYLQWVTVQVGLTPLHALLAKIVESGQVTWDGIYTTHYDRLNLTTAEPAEAGRMILLYLWPMLLLTDRPGDQLFSLNRVLAVLALPLLLATKSATTVAGLGGFLLLALLRPRHGLTRPDAIRFGACAIGGAALAAVLLPYLETVVLEKLAGADPENRSSETRYAFAVASARLIAMNPLTGVGWANEIYWLESVLPRWGWNYEIKKAFAEGNALSAKSGFLRLATYGGLPALVLWCAALLPFGRTPRGTWRGQPMLAAWPVLFLLLNTLDGGILSSAYPWFFLGLHAAATGARETAARRLRLASPVPRAPLVAVPAP